MSTKSKYRIPNRSRSNRATVHPRLSRPPGSFVPNINYNRHSYNPGMSTRARTLHRSIISSISCTEEFGLDTLIWLFAQMETDIEVTFRLLSRIDNNARFNPDKPTPQY